MLKLTVKYFLGVLLGVPCLPFLIRDGKRIRANVPSLPEAIHPQGNYNDHGNRHFNLLTLGESTMAGVGVKEHKDGITGTLASFLSKNLKLNVNWQVIAHNGYTMKRVLYKIIPQTTDLKPDLIVIAMGGNDSFKGNSPSTFAKYATLSIKTLQQLHPNVPIVFMNMPPIKDFPAFTKLIKFFLGNLVRLHGQALKKVVENYEQVYYLSEEITFKDWIHKTDAANNVDDFFSDGVHPSEMTYQLWARETGQFIIENKILNQTQKVWKN